MARFYPTVPYREGDAVRWTTSIRFTLVGRDNDFENGDCATLSDELRPAASLLGVHLSHLPLKRQARSVPFVYLVFFFAVQLLFNRFYLVTVKVALCLFV